MILFSNSSFNQTTKFDVFSEKHKLIGALEATQSKNDSVTQIDVFGQFDVTLFFKINVKYTLNTIYHSNFLFANTIVTYKNNTINSVSSTTKVGEQYKIKKNGEELVYSKAIHFSESLLYFKEPKGYTTVYSEFDGIDKQISKSADNHYKIHNPVNGQISEYFYNKGILIAAIVQVQSVEIRIEKQN